MPSLRARPARFMSDGAWRRFREIRAARDPDRLFGGFPCDDEARLNQPLTQP